MTKSSHRLTSLILFACVLALLVLRLPAVIAQDDEDQTEIAPASTPTPPPAFLQITAPSNPPRPAQTFTQDDLTLDVLFDRLQQGRIGVLRLQGEDLASARVRFRDQDVSFFYDEDNDLFYAFIAAGVDLTANRDYEITVMAIRQNGDSVTLTGTVLVVLGGFIRQDVVIPAERAYLIDPIVERTELARLNSLFTLFTPEKLWDDDGFIFPVSAETTSPFGAFRVFNGTTESRHTGWDFRVPVGTPVRTTASGRVAFAGLLDIRGNHVIIDHGQGIYSGYSHFSQMHVTRGQTVRAGQIIGVSGNTGRSSGPHLHWEVTVNGEWVDSLDFLGTWLP